MSSAETTPECQKEGLPSSQGIPIVPTIKGSKSSSDLSPNSQSSPGSPETGPIYTGIGRPVSSDFVDVPIFQVKDSSIFVLMTFPTPSQITGIAGITTNRQNLHPQYKVASPYGDPTGFKFDDTTRFVPGDYCLGLIFQSPEEAQSVSHVRILLQAEPVSNFLVAQMIFGLCRSLGFEPSHVMKYPVRSVNPSQPFYRKIRTEISKLSERIDQLQSKEDTTSQLLGRFDALESAIRAIPSPKEDIGSQLLDRINALESAIKAVPSPKVENLGSQMVKLSEKIDTLDTTPRLSHLESMVNEIRKQPTITVEQIQEQFKTVEVQIARSVANRQEKGSSEPIQIEMIEQLILEKESYLNKLREAEDYIDQLTIEEKKKPVKSVQWFQPDWDLKKPSRR